MLDLSWKDVGLYVDLLISEAEEDGFDLNRMTIWGVPRGGSIVAGLIQAKRCRDS